MPVLNQNSAVEPAIKACSMTGERQTPRGGKPWSQRPVFFLGLAAILMTPQGCHWAASSQNSTGATLYQQGQYSAALQHFQKAIATDPNNADGYYNLAATNHRLGMQRNDQAMLAQAESLYNQCLDHDPNHVECHRGLAVLLVDTGRPDRAFALMKNWAAQNPGFAEPPVELARLYEEVNDPQAALKYLEDAVQKDPNNARAWLALGLLREKSGDYTQAVQNYQRSLAINSNQPMAAERVATLNHQLSATHEATVAAGQTQIAAPTAVYGGGFNNRL
jgi:tetratricopeptide (TPR) repeat protein